MAKISKEKPYCELYVWLGRDSQGGFANALSGGKQSRTALGARCGHASLGIFDGEKTTYISFWPGGKGAIFVESLEKDQINEGGRPDSIIRLQHLDIPKMLKEFEKLNKRQQAGQLRWVMQASNSQDITHSKNTTANCASCAYSILKAGGLTDARYAIHHSGTGPQDPQFYSKVKCDVAMVANGIFDGAPWTNSHFTPKALLLRVASAAEAYFDDIQATTKIMSSNRVSSAKSRST